MRKIKLLPQYSSSLEPERPVHISELHPTGCIVDFRIGESNGTGKRIEETFRHGIMDLQLHALPSMLRRRVRDWIDAQHLLQFTPELDLGRVREHLARITARGYAREQDLEAKLTLVLRDVGHRPQ